jgi:phytoene synthase
MHEPSSDQAFCAATLRGGSRSFHAAARLLPQRVREDAIALYAFCREADDAIDNGRQHSGAALAELRHRLDAVMSGVGCERAADRAFAAVVARHAIPRTLPDALLEGFSWDAECRRYETLDDVLTYAARVAGTVGAMMAILMGARQPHLLARACDLGVAMQLTNIARDVGEDARVGRVYLPLAWLREAGIDVDGWLARPGFSPALGRVIARLLVVADGLYARADEGIARLPYACRPSMYAARVLYAEIGREVARQGFDAVSQRAVVSGRRKRRVLARALLDWMVPLGGDRLHDPALAATRFLVEAVPSPGHEGAAVGTARITERIDARIGWLVELFDRLERRERAVRSPQSALAR